jgi:hypothetical protein
MVESRCLFRSLHGGKSLFLPSTTSALASHSAHPCGCGTSSRVVLSFSSIPLEKLISKQLYAGEAQ